MSVQISWRHVAGPDPVEILFDEILRKEVGHGSISGRLLQTTRSQGAYFQISGRPLPPVLAQEGLLLTFKVLIEIDEASHF
jgi:hypothetical protein